jgi:hypothetical protein
MESIDLGSEFGDLIFELLPIANIILFWKVNDLPISDDNLFGVFVFIIVVIFFFVLFGLGVFGGLFVFEHS